ncbi:probable galacturonosyltransferase 6 [Lathyrus oleraceus]|uniref:probable galacturonosyltransferase 6 n=1 Tax=Pisum sativum TaxID=3888 RepID=UPI0021D1C1AA|nr:probable galacturonosyltransferase 6 [Pisum sativum]
MIEKVIAGVGTCQEGETSFRRMDMFINFSNPYIAKRFDVNACTWAFGMNLFDLQQWRRHNLTGVYHKYLQKGSNMPLFSTGSLPLAWLTFYNKTMVLDRRWHIVGLGYDSVIDTNKIEQAWQDTRVIGPTLSSLTSLFCNVAIPRRSPTTKMILPGRC